MEKMAVTLRRDPDGGFWVDWKGEATPLRGRFWVDSSTDMVELFTFLEENHAAVLRRRDSLPANETSEWRCQHCGGGRGENPDTCPQCWGA